MPLKRKSNADHGVEPDSDNANPKANAKRQTRSTDQAPRTAAAYNMKRFPITKAYRFIEPGPILLVSTGSLADNSHNLMTVGFHMMMQHESPARIGICIGPWDASFATLRERRNCVLCIPTVEMAKSVVDIGNCSKDDGVDKWKKFGLEPLAPSTVEAPLVGSPDVIANIECVVEDTGMVDKYSMWVLKVVRAWCNEELLKTGKMMHHRGLGIFAVDGEEVDLQDRMTKWKQFAD